jgi:hypothetical protein
MSAYVLIKQFSMAWSLIKDEQIDEAIEESDVWCDSHVKAQSSGFDLLPQNMYDFELWGNNNNKKAVVLFYCPKICKIYGKVYRA